MADSASAYSPARTDEDPWVGEDGPWIDETELARLWLEARAPDEAKLASFLYVLFGAVLVGVALWTLTAYGAYRLLPFLG